MKNTICKYAFRNLNTIRIEFVKELNNDPAMRNDISEDHDMSVVSWWGGDENNIFYRTILFLFFIKNMKQKNKRN